MAGVCHLTYSDMDTSMHTAQQPMTKFCLYLGADLRRQLEQLSADTGAPIGEIFRRAAVAWIQRQQQNQRPS
jgi:hypothetical protein